MRRLSLFILSGFLCSFVAFAGGKGRIGTAAGGDPTDIGSNGGVFTFNPVNGGGVFDYHNIGPDPITDITMLLTATADANEAPFSFTSHSVAPTQGEKFVLDVTGLEQPPLPGGQPLIDWTFYSYIFSQITLTGSAVGIDCSGGVNASDACLTITFSGGSIPVGGFFGFDLNDDYTADICTPNSDDGPCTVGTFLPDAATNPPSGGFAGVTVASGTVNGPGTVPEPVTLGMVGIAGAGLALFRLRRRPAVK
jgi:hypothetical protein